MKLYNLPSRNLWPELCRRPVQDNLVIFPVVKKIIETVKKNGDRALKNYNQKFDGVTVGNLAVTQAEMASAGDRLAPALKDALQKAKENIERFHIAQKEPVHKIETNKGVTCWRESRPIERVGLYIPGGSAPLFSTVLMLGVPAMLAGCSEIVLCTPANKEGAVHDAVLYAASLCGISKIYKIGGAQAIAAMAWGTESVPAVYKIFGPGNQYVTAAKQLVQDRVAIDMPAGPSEVLVVADETAVPAFVAADLLAQAEHGADSQVLLVTTQKSIATLVKAEIKTQLKSLPRRQVAQKALVHSRMIVVSSIAEAIEFSNVYAPEHLILSCRVNNNLLNSITSAGSVFIGNYSPESAGDYASGTNHTLPTNGNALMYSGVSLDSFYKKITFQQLTRKGLQSLTQTITTMAEAEGLQAHSNAVKIRGLNKLNQ